MSSELEAFRQAVVPLLAEMAASANAHDTDRHLAAYATDPALIFIIDGEMIQGWDALRERQRHWWSDGRATGSYAYAGEATCQVLGANLGLTTQFIAARARLPDGQVAGRMAYRVRARIEHPAGALRTLEEAWT
jgi:hypothetical protein